jgi:prepilin signal peptidase PulO-like enzyme (type II secretory pathway)
LEAITTFRSNSIKVLGRASYGIVVDNSSYPAAVYSIIKIYIHYLFAPFPWQVGGLSDLYASMESIMRMILIYFSVKQWCYAKDSQRRLLGLMLILYFSMTFMWSLGTTNYGTSIRHHMLSWWVIVIVGIPPLMEKLSRFSFRPIVNSSSHRLEVTGENFDRN